LPNYKIAIIGAGPAGYFTTQALQKAQGNDLSFEIDMIERLPTPWGLVRSGVAPDHQKTKTVSKVFEAIGTDKSFRLFANVEFGKDISLKELRNAYDVVVLAIGTPIGRKLGIMGEDLNNCISAADIVPWYNGHPDFTNVSVDLSTDTALIIGAGNVAIDIARILSTDPADLDTTDISLHALNMLKSSKIKRVVICGRRGPEHASFSANELKALLKLNSTDISIKLEQINSASERMNQLDKLDKDLQSNLSAMRLIAELPKSNKERKLEIIFLAAPKEIKGNGKVEEVVFAINEIIDGKVFESDNTFSIKTGLVITAIGYDSANYSEVKIENGRIANIAGHVEHNVYVTGWAKRGPVGVIGTNKSDSKDVVDLIIRNLKVPKNLQGIERLLKSKHKVIDLIGWKKINASELIAGELAGKPRVKEVDWDRLIHLGSN
jgi:ferredoxin--NADP+ reductase